MTISLIVVGVVGAGPAGAVRTASVGRTAVAAPQAQAGLPEPGVSPDKARDEAHDILAGAAYQEPPKTWSDQAKEWVLDKLGQVFGNINGGAGGPIVWGVLALLVGLLVFLLVRLRGGARLPRRGDEDPLFVTELEAARSPTEWLREAERLEANGEWKAALRCRYRALIGHLIDEGVVRDIPGRTSGEFRAETRRRAPAVAPAFASASDMFDEAWYGDRQTGQAENARFQQLAAEVTRQSRAHRDREERDAKDREGPLHVTVGDR